MRLFLDANVLISVLNREYPGFMYSSRILSLVDSPRYHVYTSPLCLAIAYYFAEKKSGQIRARKKIDLLSEKIKITQLNTLTVRKALANQSIHDFEDGLEYYSAIDSKCECIVTANISDYYFSTIEVVTPADFITRHRQ